MTYIVMYDLTIAYIIIYASFNTHPLDFGLKVSTHCL